MSEKDTCSCHHCHSDEHHHHTEHEHHHEGHSCDHGITGHCHVSDFSNKKRIIFVMIISFLYMLLEIVFGFLSGSLSLLADAGHAFIDSASLLLAFLGFHLAGKEIDEKRSYGYHRFEILAAFVNGLFLAAIITWIFIEAVQRILNPVDVNGEIVFVVALGGFIFNGASFFVLFKGDKKNLNMQGALLHVAGDALASLTAMIAGAVIAYTGYTIIDPILSLLLVVILGKGAYEVIRKSGHILLEGTPAGFNQEEVKKTLEEIDGIENIHHIHAWSLTLEKPLLTLHIKIKDNHKNDDILNKTKEILKEKWNIVHTVIQIEKDDCPDSEGTF
ncbi:MAG: cation diffusion facilitator family transporter [Alphaproteobacteria bacterium]